MTSTDLEKTASEFLKKASAVDSSESLQNFTQELITSFNTKGDVITQVYNLAALEALSCAFDSNDLKGTRPWIDLRSALFSKYRELIHMTEEEK